MTDWIDQTELVKRWGKSRQAAADWSRRPGCPKRTRAGKVQYQWPEFLEWWASERERAARAQRTQRTGTLADIELRHATAKAEMAEMELQQRRGELVPVEDAVRETGLVLDRLRARLLAFPQRWAPILVGCRGLPEMAAKLDAAIYDAMVELSTGGNRTPTDDSE